MMKNYNIQIKDAVFLPYYKPEELAQENPVFNEAYEHHFGLGVQQDIVKAIHGYGEALLDGCPEAGVNILQIICKSIASAAEAHPEAPKVLQERLQLHIDILIDVFNHPGGWYYDAISLILKLCDVEDEEEGCAEGFGLMEELVAEKNCFALAFMELYNEE